MTANSDIEPIIIHPGKRSQVCLVPDLEVETIKNTNNDEKRTENTRTTKTGIKYT